MSNLLKKINTNYPWIFIAFLFFPYVYKFSIPTLDGGFYLVILKLKDLFDRLQDVLVLFSFLVIIVLYIIKKRKPTKLLVILLVFELCLFISTLANGLINIREMMLYSISSLGIAALIDLFYKDNFNNLSKGIIINFEFFLYLNFISILLFRNTNGHDGSHYLLGYYNTMLTYAYPAIAISIVYMFKCKKYVRPIFLICISVLTIVLSNGSTALGALIGSIACIILYWLIIKFKFKTKYFIYIMIVLLVIFNLFILFAYSGNNFPILDVFIEKVLNRQTNFTGRTPIWEITEALIREKPILGYGYGTTIDVFGSFTAAHAHNNYLNVLLVSGVVGFVVFIVFNVIMLRGFNSSKDSYAKIVLFGLIFGIFLSYVTEAYPKDYMFNIVFFLAYRLKINEKND